ncbi:MarR family winged helix-turn-helix transcriptional regulator [Altericroceibacterium endophyticum]|uniref:MarR family transcriptional regulator n=1 Tax=Altericroceibacterium endophyticum TaxID=1808508 RepID=A0A6I4T5L6_9SPHN|nr:MarR family transcriptional regulator [Altericroceibacterium endophyticum]MXO66166.1 MarR family transcriptional regulator [Altericroceibacterium endophyticum]
MSLPASWTLFGPDHIPQRLLLLAKMIDRISSKRLQHDFGISVAQWRVLAFICTLGPTSGSYLGEASEIDPSEISRAVKAMLTSGLVTRDYEEGSRKRQIISPTEAGKSLFEKVRDTRRTYFTEITKDLSSDERVEFDRAMEVIAKAVIRERDQA